MKSFTTGEVAKLLQVNATSIINWTKKGKLSGYKTPGGHRRYKEDELRAFANEYGMSLDTPAANSSGEVQA